MPDDPTLASILAGDAPAVPMPTPQEATAAALQLAVLEQPDVLPVRWRFSTSDQHEWVARTVFNAIGRRLSGCAIWIRVFDGSTGVLAVLHGQVDHEMELIGLADRGALDRTVLRCLARWAFEHVCGEGLRRVVARIPARREDLRHLARRGGFKPEGVAVDFFGDGSDASIWALTRTDAATCRWFRRRGDLHLPAATEPSHSNRRVH